MTSRNVHTGDMLVSKANTEDFRSNYDTIFRKLLINGRPIPKDCDPAKYCGDGPFIHGPGSWKFKEDNNQP